MSRTDPLPPRLSLLARGATAEIYESRDQAGRPVALKYSLSRKANAGILREAEMARVLRHPALLPVLDSGMDEQGLAWLLLPLLTGRTLADWRGDDRMLVDWLTPVADALDLLHHRGWGHADLKPANLLQSGGAMEEALLLGDLGLVGKLWEPAPGGSPAYLSPSRIETGALDWTDDLHAFAVLGFEALSGELPYGSLRGEALLAAIRGGDLQNLTRYRPELPTELDHFFAAALRGESGVESMMGWMDDLRAHFGLDPAPRCLFFNDAPLRGKPGEKKTDGESREAAGKLREEIHAYDPKSVILDGLSRDALRDLVGERLSSVTHSCIPPGQEELSVLEDLFRGSWLRLSRILEFLLSRQLLRDDAGWASFRRPPSYWRRDLESHLAQDTECSVREEASPAAELSRRDLEEAWALAQNNPEARLRLLEQALSQLQHDWIRSLSGENMLDIANQSTRDRQRELIVLANSMKLPAAVASRIGILETVYQLREGDLIKARNRFWEIESELDLGTSGELNRLLTYEMLDAGKVDDGFQFLSEWKRCRGEEIKGTELEIRVAAREITAYAKYGDPSKAATLAEGYQREFAGRRGLWILHMALANVALERSDSVAAVEHMEAALSGVREEEGSLEMELDLMIVYAGNLIAWGQANGISRVPAILDDAFSKAEKLGDSLLIERALSVKSMWEIHCGRYQHAEDLLKMAIRSTQQSGNLQRSPYFRVNMALSIYYQGDYRRLLPIADKLASDTEEFDSLDLILNTKNILALFMIDFGRLEQALRYVEEALPIAAETGATKNEGYLLLKRAFIHHYRGEKRAALDDLAAATRKLVEAKAEDEVWRCRLWRIELAPAPAGDGEELAEIIASFEGIAKPRYLPFAWCLVARQQRLAGDLEGAAEALGRGFAIARRLGNPENIWPLHAESAELAGARNDRAERRRQLNHAVEILRDLSLHFPAGKARDLFLARSDRSAVLAGLRARGN